MASQSLMSTPPLFVDIEPQEPVAAPLTYSTSQSEQPCACTTGSAKAQTCSVIFTKIPPFQQERVGKDSPSQVYTIKIIGLYHPLAEKARDILEMIWNFPRFFRVFSPAGGIFRNSEPVWCPHCFLCLLFSRKGNGRHFFCFSKKKMPGKKKRDRGKLSDAFPGPLLSTRALLWTCGVWKSENLR